MALDKAFAVKVNSIDNPVEEVDVGGSGVTLRVRDRINFGDTITVSYVAPATSKITDRLGNALASFTDQSIDNEVFDPSDTDPPMFDGGSTDVEGVEISISFDEDVIAAIPPNEVVSLNELDSGEDSQNANRYFIEWRWSPGEANEDNARDYYEYRYRRVTTPASAFSNWERDETGSVRIGNLLANATYEIEVRATNTGGSSDAVSDVADTPIVSSGKAPINFRTTSKGRVANGASWAYEVNFAFARDASDDAPLTRYEYRHKETSSNSWSGWVDNGTSLTFSINTLKRNTSYDFEVRLVNFIGVSNAATLTDMVTFNAPNALANFAAIGSRTGSSGSYAYQLNLTWDLPSVDATNTIDAIRYRYKLASASNYGSWVTLANTSTATAITGLAHTSLYDVQIEATNNTGSGPAGDVSDVVAFAKPDPATMLTCVFTRLSNRTNNVTYSWSLPDASTNKTIDEVLTRTRKTTNAWGAFVSQAIDHITETVTGADDNSTYEIQVKTSNNVGESSVVTASCDVQVLGPGPTIEVFINLAAYLVQVVASDWDIPATKSIEWEYHLGGETAWRPLGIKDVSSLGEFEIVLVNTRWSEGSLPQGTTLAGTRGRLRGLDENGDPLTEWSIATAVEQ